MPVEDTEDKNKGKTTNISSSEAQQRPAASRRAGSHDRTRRSQSSHKPTRHLFTVRPGGIAGYMGLFLLLKHVSIADRNYAASLCGIPSYVDIVAKVDTYVGLLPYHALERLVERKPIVQLTLAKRLISLLSPLGE